MVAEEVFVNFYSFNLIRVDHASIHVQSKYRYQYSRKVIFKILVKLSGAGAAVRICGLALPELKEIFLAPQLCFLAVLPF
jgi:hypothetical protein